MSGLLDGKVVLINGGTQGVGGAVACAALREGAQVVVTGRRLDTGKLFGETFRYRDTLIKQLGLTDVRTVEPDPVALHKYLTFSFVPGEDVPIRGIRRLLPGHVATVQAGRVSTRRV